MSDSLTNSAAARAEAGAVERLAVEAIPERPRRPNLNLRPVPTEQPPEQPVIQRVPVGPTPAELMNSAFRAIARVLAVRLQLLLSLIGAFVLAMYAVRSGGDYLALGVLIAFSCLTVLPLVWLEYSGRPRA